MEINSKIKVLKRLSKNTKTHLKIKVFRSFLEDIQKIKYKINRMNKWMNLIKDYKQKNGIWQREFLKQLVCIAKEDRLKFQVSLF